jgi:outer membrane protein OmpA-like peptidoglycan-associated protein
MSFSNAGSQEQMQIRGLQTDIAAFIGSLGTNITIKENVSVYADFNLNLSKSVEIYGFNLGIAYSFGAVDLVSKRERELESQQDKVNQGLISSQEKTLKQLERRQTQIKIQEQEEEQEEQAPAPVAVPEPEIKKEIIPPAPVQKQHTKDQKEIQIKAAKIINDYARANKATAIDAIKAQKIENGNIEIAAFNESVQNPELIKDISAAQVDCLIVRIQVDVNGRKVWNSPLKIYEKSYKANQYKLSKKSIEAINSKIAKLKKYKIERVRIVKYTFTNPTPQKEKLSNLRAQELSKILFNAGLIAQTTKPKTIQKLSTKTITKTATKTKKKSTK